MIYYKQEDISCHADRDFEGYYTHYYTIILIKDNWIFPIDKRDVFYKQFFINVEDVYRKSILDLYGYKNKRFENIER